MGSVVAVVVVVGVVLVSHRRRKRPVVKSPSVDKDAVVYYGRSSASVSESDSKPTRTAAGAQRSLGSGGVQGRSDNAGRTTRWQASIFDGSYTLTRNTGTHSTLRLGSSHSQAIHGSESSTAELSANARGYGAAFGTTDGSTSVSGDRGATDWYCGSDNLKPHGPSSSGGGSYSTESDATLSETKRRRERRQRGLDGNLKLKRKGNLKKSTRKKTCGAGVEHVAARSGLSGQEPFDTPSPTTTG